MINPFYFTDENLKIDFKIILDSHDLNHAISLSTIEPNFPVLELKQDILTKSLKSWLFFTLD